MFTLRAGGQMVEAHTRNIKCIWSPLALLIQHNSCLEGKTISTQMPTNHSDSVTNWGILTASLSTGSLNGLVQHSQQIRQRVRRESRALPPSLSLAFNLSYTRADRQTHTHTHTHTSTHSRSLCIQTGFCH